MQNQIPKNWQKVKLGEVTDIFDSKRIPLSGLERKNCQGEYPYYGASGIIDYIDKYIFDGNYILVAEDGENLRSRNTPVAFSASGKFWVNNHAHIIKARPHLADDKFILNFLLNYDLSGFITGSAQPKLTQDNFKRIPFLLPLLPVQQKITSVLSAFDDKIEVNNKIAKTFEEMTQALFKEWFVHFRFPGYEKAKFIDSDLGKIPKGWSSGPIRQFAKVVLGGTPSRTKSDYWNGNIPWINSGEINNFRVTSGSEYITESGLRHSSARMMPRRTTLIAITGATLGQVSLSEIEVCANQSVVGIFDEKLLLNDYIYLYIKLGIKKLINQAGGGAQQHINKEIVENHPILIPDYELLDLFNKIVGHMLDDIAIKIFENQKLAAVRDLTLPKLMKGEIRI